MGVCMRSFYVIIMILLLTGPVLAANINVGTRDSSMSIQQAIDSANPHDTILVKGGTYREIIEINKPIILRGLDKGDGLPKIDAKKMGSAITLNANGITLEGFVVTNSSGESEAGIKVLSNNNTIKDNYILNNKKYGVLISRNYVNNTILYNNISLNEYGIKFIWSNNNKMRNNIINNNKFNFDCIWSKNNEIDLTNLIDGKRIYYLYRRYNVSIDSASNAGTIYCFDCRNITVKDLNISNNGCGIYFSNTTNSRIHNISIHENYYGIKLWDSAKNLITNNRVFKNDYGVYLDASGENVLKYNTIFNNLYNFEIEDAGRYKNYIDINNTIDGKHIYYIISKSDIKITDSEAGAIYCIDCHNITIMGLDLFNNTNGIYFCKTTNSRIENNFIRNNKVGIYLIESEGNLIFNNTIFNNEIGLESSNTEGNHIINNNLSNNEEGIYYDKTINSEIKSNQIKNNINGINLKYSDNNTLIQNIANNNCNYSASQSKLNFYPETS
jgi:parallel beta-helix repeat protein